MPQQTLHIVSFDSPYPPVYGGAIEVFYKLEPLQKLGIAVHLHCFVAEIPADDSHLRSLVHSVYYYKNTKNPLGFFSWLPFSVQSRKDKQLIQNILAIPAPVLFEGLKTTYEVYKKALPGIRKIMRLHNVEPLYFSGIAKSERSWVKKVAFLAESLKFRRYEKVLSQFDRIVALSRSEQHYISEHFFKCDYVPVFQGNKEVAQLNGVGNFALYHGDLRMSDNKRVAENLIRLFKQLPNYRLVIASNSIYENYIKQQIGNQRNVHFEPITDFESLKQLLHQAQMNLIFSYQRSGTKLKVMNALYHGRFCIINENILDDTEVASLCVMASSNAEIIAQITRLQNLPYTGYSNRKSILESKMNDQVNAHLLLDIIFGS